MPAGTGRSVRDAAQSRALAWQAEAWEGLSAARSADRLGHALLLTGTAGTGRWHFAQALARSLLCQAPTPQGNCGSCKNCELSLSGAHPDFLVLEPEEAGRAIGIDAVRKLLAFTAQTSARGDTRVVLVNPLEALTISACNAFLKGLEEPGRGTYFLLLHTRGRRIPATVRSRCQQVQLPAPSPDASLAWWKEQPDAQGLGAEAVEVAAALAPRSPLTALALAQGESLSELAACKAALERGRSVSCSAAALSSATSLPPLELLALLESELRLAARQLGVSGEQEHGRGRASLRAVLAAEAELQRLRRVQLSGSNPNPDLLRHAALQAYARCCEVSTDGATLGAT